MGTAEVGPGNQFEGFEGSSCHNADQLVDVPIDANLFFSQLWLGLSAILLSIIIGI